MASPSDLRYALAGEPDDDVLIRLRSSTQRAADWVAAVAPALTLRPYSGSATSGAPPAAGQIEVRSGSPHRPVPPTAERVAEDDRGRLFRTEDARRWACRGYDLIVPDASQRATVHVHEQSESSWEHQVAGSALRHAVSVLLPRMGRYPLHAAGLRAPDHPEVVVIAGPSGRGKSTLAAGLVRRGWRCLSDDLLVLVPSGGRVQVYGMTRGIRLRNDAWERLALSAHEKDEAPHPAAGRAGGTEKRVLSLGGKHEKKAEPPGCVLFPALVDRSDSTLSPLDSSHALKRVLEQMHPPAALPDSVASAQFDAAATLVRRSPCLHLAAGRDLYADPGRLADLLFHAGTFSSVNGRPDGV